MLHIGILGVVSFLGIGACAKKHATDEAIQPSTILIHEIQAGAAGNNNLEFIQLYNHGGELIDLRGWSLVYRLTDCASEPLC